MNGEESNGCGGEENRKKSKGASVDCKINQVTGRTETDYKTVPSFLPPSLPLTLPATGSSSSLFLPAENLEA